MHRRPFRQHRNDSSVYLVVDDFGQFGRAFVETGVATGLGNPHRYARQRVRSIAVAEGSKLWESAMQVPLENSWNPIESAPFDEDVTLRH